jgi:hypothetical protein
VGCCLRFLRAISVIPCSQSEQNLYMKFNKKLMQSKEWKVNDDLGKTLATIRRRRLEIEVQFSQDMECLFLGGEHLCTTHSINESIYVLTWYKTLHGEQENDQKPLFGRIISHIPPKKCYDLAKLSPKYRPIQILMPTIPTKVHQCSEN